MLDSIPASKMVHNCQQNVSADLDLSGTVQSIHEMKFLCWLLINNSSKNCHSVMLDSIPASKMIHNCQQIHSSHHTWRVIVLVADQQFQ